MFATAALLGLRAGEILGLRAEDVDLARGLLNIRQTAWYGTIQTCKTKSGEDALRFSAEAALELLRRELI